MRNSLSTRNLEMIMAIKLDAPAVADFNYDNAMAAWHSEVTRRTTTATSTSSERRDLTRTPRAAAAAAATGAQAAAAPAAAPEAAAATAAAPAAAGAAAAEVATLPVLLSAEAFQQMVQQMPVGLAMQMMR
ncbi:uncharacterized protein LOC135824376 [Sycon ciliatum]|uniref:uncharacterized protein LOC135824376 n=1 Tax=Sycon ciliatum TaxID=27933 RepID=UPI0031F6098C